MKVLVIGSGGREHALVWKLAQSPKLTRLYCAPGNAGTAGLAENVPIKADDLPALKEFALRNKIDLTVVGPEVPLVAGIADLFEQAGLKVFGPRKQGALIEGSKVWSKEFMVRHQIPTARAGIFNNVAKAKAYIREMGAPIVVKADGLAAGKGVIICRTEQESLAAVRSIMEQKAFGAAGDRVVIEECLKGEEASIIALTDGQAIVPLASSQDHKRVNDHDQGPNTGGMGAYSPAPVVTDRLMSRIDLEVLRPFLVGMKQEGIDYRGVIYAGIMVTREGPQVLEFNCRLGDPETQPIMMRLKSDLLPVLTAVVEGKLDHRLIEWDERAAVCVVLAAGGYPDKYEKGAVITGIGRVDQLPSAYVFQAGTRANSRGEVLTDGGRVLGVTALGDGIKLAIDGAYRAVDLIGFAGMHYRRDIGRRALKHLG